MRKPNPQQPAATAPASTTTAPPQQHRLPGRAGLTAARTANPTRGDDHARDERLIRDHCKLAQAASAAIKAAET
jgi:hypothetical protein